MIEITLTDPLVSISIPLVAPTLNDWYGGRHWRHRNIVARTWHKAVWVEVKNNRIGPIGKKHFPVMITTRTTFPLRARKRDTSNCFSANKLAEDALVAAKVLPDDTPKYVGVHIVLPSIYGDRERPEGVTEVRIYKVMEGIS